MGNLLHASLPCEVCMHERKRPPLGLVHSQHVTRSAQQLGQPLLNAQQVVIFGWPKP